MTEYTRYVKARIKTYDQLMIVGPEARHWGKPISIDHLFPSADEAIVPYLGKTVWVRKIRMDLCSFHYELQHSGGLIVMPDWIDYFNTSELVPPSEWVDPYHGDNNDTWLDAYEDRIILTDDLIIITG